ncbi:hypothetical protein N7478_010226 [Penicillium angulare]|uniref:uncharacterized protein n=1 Tax=Penicillium angulare TaxID=116970 RepID=UPI00254241C6|nr:uncharacterized protein N7478_010226 [Penicillium angulare]KAJ5267418.1 hypothetical protein N7478_010226 [Penicillium angulare]
MASWDDGGLFGDDLDKAIEHLKKKKITEQSEQTNANSVAKTLLGFHSDFLYSPMTTLPPPNEQSGPKRGTKRQLKGAQATKSMARHCANPQPVEEYGERIRFPADVIGARPISSLHALELSPEQRWAGTCAPSASTDNTCPETIETEAIVEPEFDMIYLDSFNHDLEMTYLDFADPTVGFPSDLNCP